MTHTPLCPRFLKVFTSCVLAAAAALNVQADTHANDNHAGDDVLAITDWGDVAQNPEANNSTVVFLNARTGTVIGQLPDGSGGLHGPNGVLHDHGRLIVANQNAFLPYNGEVIEFGPDVKAGTPLVPRSDIKGPLAPHGILLVPRRDGGQTLFIADVGDETTSGKLLAYRVRDDRSKFIRNLDPNLEKPGTLGPEFRPRGLVLGPDGYLYVSLAFLKTGCGGIIARFDPVKLQYVDKVLENPVSCNDNVNDLHRPEGLVFGPNGDLYIASFQRTGTPADIDRILIVTAEQRASTRIPLRLDYIPLDVANQPRTSTQAMVFGPDGLLYVALLQNGEVRKYNVVTKGYWTVAKAGTLKWPVFLTFFKTDPATLAYMSHR